MLIRNGLVLTDQWNFQRRDIRIEAGRIEACSPCLDQRSRNGSGSAQSGESAELDATDLYVIPGLVDLHIHGCANHDFCDGSAAAIRTIARHLASRGVTSFLGTSMSLPEARLAEIFGIASQWIDVKMSGGATLRGIHMEGPFFAPAKRGAQAEQFMIDPDPELFERLYAASGQSIRILDIAPELPGALPLIRLAANRLTVALAHSAASYDTAMAAFDVGASHVTHLYNAMTPFSHRSPGILGAAVDAGATADVICDGIHVHPSAIRVAFSLFGPAKIALVSDAMRACGLPDGVYELGGLPVHVQGSQAALADGTLAGSVTDLHAGLRRAIEFGIPLADAVKAATLNPARIAGIDSAVGSITPGKQADLLLLDQQLQIITVIINGQVLPAA
jgi:N-acetylglucosamine-6-phosphate deacetylase